MDDLVTRLRLPMRHTDTLAAANVERNLAADEIERLRALITEVWESAAAVDSAAFTTPEELRRYRSAFDALRKEAGR